MSTIQIPAYTTDAFFGLEDKWLETAEGEVTHYHEVGEGTPILFLHGSGTGVTAAANWWLNLPQLAEQARCIAIDSIGYGQSVVAEVWLSKAAGRSITMECRVLSADGILYFIARVAVVVMDVATRRPRPLTDDEVAALSDHVAEPLRFRD